MRHINTALVIAAVAVATIPITGYASYALQILGFANIRKYELTAQETYNGLVGW